MNVVYRLGTISVGLLLLALILNPNSAYATVPDRACNGKTQGQSCNFTIGSGGREQNESGICQPRSVGGGFTCRVGAAGGDPTGGGSSGDPTGGGESGDPTGGGTTDGEQDASSPQQVSFQNPSRFTSIPDLLAGIVNAALGLLGGLAVIMIVFSGIKYMTSSNPGEVSQATEGIRNAIVGLMVVMGAYLIVQFVISALV